MAQPFLEPCSRGIIEAEAYPRETGKPIAPAHRRMVLVACIVASSMGFIDGSALTVALPKLRADLGADFASVQWVLNGYVLALASLTLVGGALADLHGKSRMLAIGSALFGLTSIACALAPTVSWLIAARVAQGVSAALFIPASLALIGAVYPREERNRAIGIWAAASALTTAGGPVLGGWLTEAFSWRLIFWINPPLSLITVVLLMAFAPSDQREPRRFDIIGAGILAVSLAALAFALSEIGPGEGGAKPAAASGAGIAIAAALGGIGLGLYGYWEWVSDHPMTPPRLVQNRPFFGLNLATLMIYTGLSIMFFLVPFELIGRRGLTPIQVGLAFLPFTLGVGFLSRLFGGLADKTGARILLIVGALGAALSYVWLAFGQKADLIFGVLAPMTLLGISFAVLVAPLTASVMSSVERSDEGLASGINNAASRVAQLGGVALAAGLASYGFGYELGLGAAAALSAGGALTITLTLPPLATR